MGRGSKRLIVTDFLRKITLPSAQGRYALDPSRPDETTTLSPFDNLITLEHSLAVHMAHGKGLEFATMAAALKQNAALSTNKLEAGLREVYDNYKAQHIFTDDFSSETALGNLKRSIEATIESSLAQVSASEKNRGGGAGRIEKGGR